MRGVLRRFVLTAVAAVVAGGAAGRAGAQLVTNGDFEAVQIGSPFASSNPADIPGWTHTGSVGDALLWGIGYSDIGGSVTVAGHGRQFVTLGGGSGASGTASWQQTLTGLTPGATYTLTFMQASENFLTGQSITVDFPTGSSTGPATFTTPASSANYWRNWVTETENFVATGSTATLRFSATTQYDVGLDNVSVAPAAVPEPSVMAQVGAGLVLGLGLRWRRRRRAAG